jgi:hypothetical protein
MHYSILRLVVKCLIIERYPTRLAAPKAHALSPRTLEICRQFDLDVNDIRRLGTKRDDAYWVNFVTSLAGHYVGSLPYERMDAEVLEQTSTVSLGDPLAQYDIHTNLKDGPQHSTAYLRTICCETACPRWSRRDSKEPFFRKL